MPVDDLALMLYGILVYNKTGKTPVVCHDAFVRSYVLTNGAAQELIHSALFKPNAHDHQSRSKSSTRRVKVLQPSEMASVLFELETNGYCALNDMIDNTLIQEIISMLGTCVLI